VSFQEVNKSRHLTLSLPMRHRKSSSEEEPEGESMSKNKKCWGKEEKDHFFWGGCLFFGGRRAPLDAWVDGLWTRVDIYEERKDNQ